jgi:YidC/Oxa1 family membrane protein insertase
MNNNTNFIVAIVLSIAILMGFHWFYEVPRQRAREAQVQAAAILKDVKPEVVETMADRGEIIAASPRVSISNANMHGSINLKGGRIDDITLIRYRETVEPNSPEIVLLSPAGTREPYQAQYAEFGWLADKDNVKLPGADTVWQSDAKELKENGSVTLRWNNGEGLQFERVISVDADYMFTITEKVRNSGGKEVTLYPFALLSRHGTPQTLGYSVLHEGPIGVLEGRLHENGYKALKDNPLITQDSTGGWIGMSDVYWLTALIPDQQEKLKARFIHSTITEKDRYQVDMQGQPVVLKNGDAAEKTVRFFSGAKEVNKLDNYADTYKIPMFDKAVDFGWFYFIAKPFFLLLDFLGRFLGNYGLGIIAFTILLRALFFPLSEASYRSMAQMRELQPEMTRLRERYSNDPMKMNEEVSALYKKEKVNPLSGCLPMLVQIPVFFALYKVLMVAIEMRHTPFYGWIQDLSAKDPSNLFNLFGLLPFMPPSWLHLGAWPLLMGITMFIQQKLSPPPPDKMTQQIFMLMPIMFTFLLDSMSAGLVIYWTLSNLLAIAQQTLINHRAKKKPEKAA